MYKVIKKELKFSPENLGKPFVRDENVIVIQSGPTEGDVDHFTGDLEVEEGRIRGGVNGFWPGLGPFDGTPVTVEYAQEDAQLNDCLDDYCGTMTPEERAEIILSIVRCSNELASKLSHDKLAYFFVVVRPDNIRRCPAYSGEPGCSETQVARERSDALSPSAALECRGYEKRHDLMDIVLRGSALIKIHRANCHDEIVIPEQIKNNTDQRNLTSLRLDMVSITTRLDEKEIKAVTALDDGTPFHCVIPWWAVWSVEPYVEGPDEGTPARPVN